MFKGSVPVGTQVTASLRLSDDAKGSAFLSIAWSAGGSTGSQDSTTITPGGFGTVSVTPTNPGLLRVFVDMNRETDRGTLGVDPPTPPEPIRGDTTWTYSVE